MRGPPIDRHDAARDAAAGRRVSDFDFRRPSKLGRDVLRVLELAHETFARRLSSGWGSELRSIVQVEELGMEQMAYDDHIRSMPNPNVVFTVPVPPLPGAIVVDCNVQLAIQMVERLLGATPLPGVAGPRRPSEVESDLIRFLLEQVVSALRETLAPLVAVEPSLDALEFNPQLVQVAAPSDPALLLSYRVSLSGGVEGSGFLNVAYAAPILHPLLEILAARRQGEEEERRDDVVARQAVTSSLSEVPVTMQVRLGTTPVAASDLSHLRVGDVLRLDHRVDRPALGVVGGEEILAGHLGRRGPRLALQVADWITTPPLVPMAVPRTPASADHDPTDRDLQPLDATEIAR